jgi:iron complex outermembrane receptor protein
MKICAQNAVHAGVIVCLLLASTAAPDQILAQTTETIEEVVVTATRRAQSLQDVPIAVTAISGQQLEEAGVQDLTTLSRLAPSFNIEGAQTTATTFTFRIRGVGTTGQNVGFESSVGVFLDGVFLSRPGVALGDLVDIEQFEVLRGPQGTLFGRNTSAGALNISTKRPEVSESSGFADISYGRYNDLLVSAAYGAPLREGSSAFRVTASYHNRDGTFDSTSGGESHNRDRYMVRGQLQFEPSDTFSLRVIADAYESNEVCCDAVIINDTLLAAPQTSLGGLSLYGLVGLPNDGGVPVWGEEAINNRITAAEEFQDDISQWGLSAEANWEFDFGVLTWIPAFRDFDSEVISFPDFTGIDVYSVQKPDGSPGQLVTFETMTQEVRLQGTAFDDKLDWLLGAYYLDEDVGFESTFLLGDAYQQNTSAFLLAVDPTLPGKIAGHPLVIANPALALNPALVFAGGISAAGNYATNYFDQNTESFALFTHNIVHLTERLDLTVGLRYTDEEKNGGFSQLEQQGNSCLGTLGSAAGGFIPANVLPLAVGFACFPFAAPADLPGAGLPPAPPAFPGVPTPATFTSNFSDDEWTYTASLGYFLTNDTRIYGSYTRGYKSGGINLDPTAAIFGADPRFESEIAKSYELGLKSTLWDGRMRANIAAFYTELDNLQVLQFTGVQFNAFNVPRALTSGIELESIAVITDNLTANFAITWADARYPNNCADGANAVAIASGVATLCGNDLTAAPEIVANLGGMYEQQWDNYRWFLNGNVRYESEQRTRTFPEPFDVDDANTKFDLRFGFGPDGGFWTVELWGMNLTDEETRNVAFSVPLRGAGPVGATGAFYEEPRTYGVTFRTRF